MKVGFFGGKFIPFHMGHLNALIQCANQVDLLYVGIIADEEEIKTLCEGKIKYPSQNTRMSWIGECIQGFSNIKLFSIDMYGDDWAKQAECIKQHIPEQLTHIFSSEKTYTKIFNVLYPGVKHVIIDHERKEFCCSGTQIRDNVYKNWKYLPKAVRKFFIKKVAIIGTESVGKSILTKQLSLIYNTNYVEEVGRTFCEKYSNQLTEDMFYDIAVEHAYRQKIALSESNKVLFVDSDAVITQYYYDMYFNKHSSDIDDIIKKQDVDLYLYLNADIPWVDDGIRFAGSDAERKTNNKKLQLKYKDYGITYMALYGSFNEKTVMAKRYIKHLFNK